MNLEDVARCIEDPSLCKADYISDLESLIAKYPYSQSFPILLLKTLGAEKSLNFDDALNAHAFRVSDRIRLYELIQAKEENSFHTSEIEETVEIQTEESTLQETSDLEEAVIASEENNSPEMELKIEPEAETPLEEVVETVEPASIESIQEEIREEFHVSQSFEESDITELETSLVPEFENDLTSTPDDVAAELVEPEEAQIMKPTETESEEEEMELKIELVEEDLDEEDLTEELEVEIPVDQSEEFDAEEEEVQLDEEIPALIEENNGILNSEDKESTENSTFNVQADEDSTRNRTTSEALAQSFHLTMEKPSKKENEETALDEELTSTKKTKKHKKKKKEKEKEKEKESKKSKKKEKEKSDKKSDKKKKKKSFSGWLHPEQSEEKNPKNTDLKESTIESSLPIQPDKTVEVETKAKNESIIDDFIEKEPKIRRFEETLKEEIKEKVPFYSPLEKAKESINEDVMPVSETLAKIYVAQGNYPKAILAYNQLMLLFPEKKIFFADQIRKLEQNTN